MLILDLWGISIHAVIVFGLGKNLLFKSVLGHCGWVGLGWVGCSWPRQKFNFAREHKIRERKKRFSTMAMSGHNSSPRL